MKKILLNTALCSSLLLSGGSIAPVVAEPVVVSEVPSWSFELSPYAAMSSISEDSALISGAVGKVELPFDDILDALEFGIVAHFEAHHSMVRTAKTLWFTSTMVR